MSIPTDDDRELLTVVATMRAKPGKEQDLQQLLESLIPTTRGEDGNHTYALHRGTQDPQLFIFYENWSSQQHLDQHLAAPHLQAAIPQFPELLDGELNIMTVQRIA